MSMRCLIVDDSARFLEAARALLERGGVEVVGVAFDGRGRAGTGRGTGPGRRPGLISTSTARTASSLAPSSSATPRSVGDPHLHPPLDDFQELVAAGPAHGFLHKSAFSRRALGTC